ncbi:hypothetical protein HBH70_071330 [Parastagonospora nodorum]|nr:hypothetical protein HBH52_027300 [Parastagonospora nodorum]KAH4259101.1 hypothetical protein HBI03_140140 [Parastagonospora nodorum]KAH4276479.1 hypothetical protein HBI04_109280 [Parastagonospora nodorum]KAH4608468.1 hypothetical protein HBH82_074560 [Parastagonospora nodorum]KAH4689646.1 hypothetical protein HBH78_094580 [Parastagonospora nodorum]
METLLSSVEKVVVIPRDVRQRNLIFAAERERERERQACLRGGKACEMQAKSVYMETRLRHGIGRNHTSSQTQTTTIHPSHIIYLTPLKPTPALYTLPHPSFASSSILIPSHPTPNTQSGLLAVPPIPNPFHLRPNPLRAEYTPPLSHHH